MNSSTTLHSQPVSKPGRKPRRAGEGEELGMKPKKVNSEVRKQQNRIASRNYREKRKRKLQYLQQLIKDGSNDEETPQASPQQHEAYVRSLSAECDASGPSSSPFMLPSNSNFTSLQSSAPAIEPIHTPSTAAFNSHIIATTQAYSRLEPSWSTPIYDPPPPTNITWNVSAWMPSIDYAPRVAPGTETYHYTAPTGPPVFAQNASPYHYPQELVPNADHYVLGSSYGPYNGSHSQTPGIPSDFFGTQPFALERFVYT